MVEIGTDILCDDRFDLVKGKRIGLIVNHSATLKDGRHLADVLLEREGVSVVAMFAPEHGVHGDAPDRKAIKHERDPATGIPVFSIFGKLTKPTTDMLKDIDLLVYSIQDVGARFYTYMSTLVLTMEAAAEQRIPYAVLDRPNPIRGTWIEGPVREDSLKSFFGLIPLPVIHGLTIGEVALLANESGCLPKGTKADLTVVRLRRWKRSMWYDETGLQWICPSPSMRTLQTAVVYPGTCLLEGTNVSEGRGTERPFEYLGAPWTSGSEWANDLNSYRLPGVQFEEIEFVPRGTQHLTSDSKYENQPCHGVYVNVTGRDAFQPVRTGLFILYSLRKLYPKMFLMRRKRFDELMGVRCVRKMLEANCRPDEIARGWEEGLREFGERRKAFLLYT